MKKIVGMGNALVDLLVQLPNDEVIQELGFPKGSMQLVDAQLSGEVMQKLKRYSMEQASGGSSGNTIHAMSALGINATFVGKVGEGVFGNFYRNDLTEAGINPILKESSTETGKAIAMISQDGERTFATYLGAAVELMADEITPDIFQGHDIFHIEGYLVQNHELLRKSVRLAKESGNLVSLDLASFNVVQDNLAFLQDIMDKYVDIVFANEDEAKAFTNKPPREALDKITDLVKVAVVKIGKEGAYIKNSNGSMHVSATKSNVKDTTGAGDLFAAGFLYGFMNKWPLEKCGKAGALMAGKIIEKIGARLNKTEIMEIRTGLNKL